MLIHGGAGAVGRAAIQMAKNAGATVATTVSDRGKPVVEKLGADVIINYLEQRFEQVVKDYDFVLDAGGGSTLRRSFRVLRKGGKLCSISGMPEPRTADDLNKGGLLRHFYWLLFACLSLPLLLQAKLRGVDYRFVFMRPDGQHLKQIAT